MQKAATAINCETFKKNKIKTSAMVTHGISQLTKEVGVVVGD